VGSSWRKRREDDRRKPGFVKKPGFCFYGRQRPRDESGAWNAPRQVSLVRVRVFRAQDRVRLCYGSIGAIARKKDRTFRVSNTNDYLFYVTLDVSKAERDLIYVTLHQILVAPMKSSSPATRRR